MHLLRHPLPRPARGDPLTAPSLPRLLVGLGNPDRGDDGAGPAVVTAVIPRLPALSTVQTVREVPAVREVQTVREVPAVRAVTCADPADLLHLWARTGLVIVVDAVRAGPRCPPGSLTLLRTGPGEPPLPSGVRAGAGGTHALGLVEAVELARALDRLPRRLVVLGIRATRFDPGAPLSPPVAAAVEAAADRVQRLLR